ncbi:putative RRN3-like protein RRN3P1 [Asterias amurensis]|uniref:putative RRN3-like protein RRN3P1 n=1 Tax=Asterias amurensis TaxID=7602 RepID=UPI003AB41944
MNATRKTKGVKTNITRHIAPRDTAISAIIESFLEYLRKRFTNPNTPAILRQATASYIASFISRANFLPHSTVTACLDLMVGWINYYIEKQESNPRLLQDVNVHGPFYSLCQKISDRILLYNHGT